MLYQYLAQAIKSNKKLKEKQQFYKNYLENDLKKMSLKRNFIEIIERSQNDPKEK